ncbi:ATP-dependent DNA helicase, partial [Chloroflexota bacterium]
SKGPLAQAFPGFERRSQQVKMMAAVAEALNTGENLIVEAGTGTGKSIAYLLPAITFSLDNRVPVVISTNTINLQEQLVEKDIPDLLGALGTGLVQEDLRVAQVKGRSNYLCLRRWASHIAGGGLSPEEARLMARVRLWLESTQSGDCSELRLNATEAQLWKRLSAQIESCRAGSCQHYHQEECFLYGARKAAQEAHIIVVNHSLLLSDIMTQSGILPEYRHLVIDEAHHLEDEATRQLGSQITRKDLLDFLNELGEGLSSRVLGRLGTAATSRRKDAERLVGSLSRRAARVRGLVSELFDLLGGFIERWAEGGGEYEHYLRVTNSIRSQPAWSDLEAAGENLSLALGDIAADLERLYIGIESIPYADNTETEELSAEIGSRLSSCRELADQINSFLCRPDTNGVFWVSLSDHGSTVSLCTAPLSVGGFLEKTLFQAKDCAVLTGATLSTEGGFEYMKSRFGIEEASEVLLESPFDYMDSTMLYIPRDIPEPGRQGYQPAVEEALVGLCRATGGRALVLFTSHSALRATQSAIQTPLEEADILVLGHGVDGSPKQLLAAFKSNPKSVLLGTASFWEGVDIVGETLSVLVIARLPFAVPTEPVFAARSETYIDAFNQFALPQAILRFKQGFGRLIRSRGDRGAIVVLDSRLQRKGYGRAFLDSLPPCTVMRGPARNLPAAVTSWLESDTRDERTRRLLCKRFTTT